MARSREHPVVAAHRRASRTAQTSAVPGGRGPGSGRSRRPRRRTWQAIATVSACRPGPGSRQPVPAPRRWRRPGLRPSGPVDVVEVVDEDAPRANRRPSLSFFASTFLTNGSSFGQPPTRNSGLLLESQLLHHFRLMRSRSPRHSATSRGPGERPAGWPTRSPFDRDLNVQSYLALPGGFLPHVVGVIPSPVSVSQSSQIGPEKRPSGCRE